MKNDAAKRSAPKLSEREVLLHVTASLAAAISILERIPGAPNAVASDTMFKQMIDDYKRSLEAARSLIRGD